MQKQRVVAWLSQHNFPHGIVSFCDGLVHDPLRHKANFLKTLTEVRVGAVRGSMGTLYVCDVHVVMVKMVRVCRGENNMLDSYAVIVIHSDKCALQHLTDCRLT